MGDQLSLSLRYRCRGENVDRIQMDALVTYIQTYSSFQIWCTGFESVLARLPAIPSEIRRADKRHLSVGFQILPPPVVSIHLFIHPYLNNDVWILAPVIYSHSNFMLEASVLQTVTKGRHLSVYLSICPVLLCLLD